jgi:putative transposase
MPGPQATAIQLNDQERAILEQIVRQPSSPQGLVTRSQIILRAADGESISAQAREMGVPVNRVRHWRRVWSDSAIEREAVVDERLRRSVLERILADAPRAGAPITFSAEQVVQLIAVSCEEPSPSGYPDSHWSQNQIAREVVKRGIVEHISGRQVGRFLKRGGC